MYRLCQRVALKMLFSAIRRRVRAFWFFFWFWFSKAVKNTEGWKKKKKSTLLNCWAVPIPWRVMSWDGATWHQHVTFSVPQPCLCYPRLGVLGMGLAAAGVLVQDPAAAVSAGSPASGSPAKAQGPGSSSKPLALLERIAKELMVASGQVAQGSPPAPSTQWEKRGLPGQRVGAHPSCGRGCLGRGAQEKIKTTW